ncbi:pyruvate dehydrogenase (acetyl-transferring) E1 component subunit alpha [Fontibacter flavus]|uniref:Pyruvate dehydrogenase E1 component subunit alpha n=1 Tax=Fontibacter flavus TaxID=654838 RepID=A0ABV6FPL3_9BACT
MKTKAIKEYKMTAEEGKHLLHQMILIRRFEEKAAEEYTKSKIRGFLHLYVGEEAVAVGVMHHLHPEDYVLSTYREHGHALARGMNPEVIMAEMFGKVEGCSKGRGGSMHLFDTSLNFFGGNAIVGGHLPLAVGMALGAKKQKKGNVTCCFFGEGAAAEGEFHESLNLAALWETPTLFVCENNLYAMGTAIRYTHSMQQLEKKGEAYGIQSSAVDGMDLLAVLEATQNAVEYIKKTGKPYFLVCNTYRFRAHSMFDAELYRDKKEVEEWKNEDPIPKFKSHLFEKRLITQNEIEDLEQAIEEMVEKSIVFAEEGTWEDVNDLHKYVYTEPKAL